MEIEKIFSEIDTDERLYSVLMDDEEYDLYSEFQDRLYGQPGITRYDMTDRLKGMKDSDILAEKKKSNFLGLSGKKSFYNNRLEYMQNQARRREYKDWHNNAVNRDGYTS